MKKIKLSILAASALALGTLAFVTGEVLPIGSSLPMIDEKMMNVDGKEITLKDVAKGKGLLVMFSCNTCPYVIKNQERTIEAADRASNLDIGTILINSNEALRGDADSPAAMKDYAQEQKYMMPYTIDKDSKIADAFGATKTPEVFLFDGEMKLVYHGAIDDNPTDANNVKRNHLFEAMKELNAGKKITVTESKGVGCGIKRVKK